ncbi:hypothetical protein N7505_007408 [Penicillium chrysogenum]|uniref:Ankyrin repeat protein n=1 Tax=Penicillium chrysogenum TaxID=5076 RepID=A0ABQ8WDH4_PENCH|nr:hypothetical protein N7505_007408 [Penicillium chrysogenum]
MSKFHKSHFALFYPSAPELQSAVQTRPRSSIWKYNIEFQNSNLLHLAVKYDNVGLAEALLQHKANIDALYRGKTPLMRALKYSSAAACELLLNGRELDINIQNKAHDSALSYVIHYGTYSTLKRVLEQPNVRVDVKHRHGRTALHLAVFAGRIGFVHLLLTNGSDPDLQDDSGHSPWDWARHFNRSVMEMIFSNDPMSEVFLGTQSSQDAELPLHRAVSYGSSKHLEIVNLLLSDPRVNVNCTDKDGNTPLWLSTYSSCDEITERLLAEKGINVNFAGGRGRFETASTSLHHAATKLDTVVLRQLLAVPGVNPNISLQASLQVLLLHITETIKGVEINGKDIIDRPLFRAVAHGHLDVVRLVVQQGARLKINESTITTHDTGLCIAARGGDLEMVQALLRHGEIGVNLRSQWFEDPLMLAVKGEHYSIVNALVVDPRLDTLQPEEISGFSKGRLHPEGHSNQNGRCQYSPNIVEAVPEEMGWWSVRAGDIHFR